MRLQSLNFVNFVYFTVDMGKFDFLMNYFTPISKSIVANVTFL
jgi:hypothetical protein